MSRILVDGAGDTSSVIVATTNGRYTAQRPQTATHHAVAIVAAVVAGRIAAGTEACVVIGIPGAHSRSHSSQTRIVVGQRIGIRVVAAAVVATAIAAQRGAISAQGG